MGPSRSLGVAVATFNLLVMVCADPECKLFPVDEVVCTPGPSDSSLKKGLFSDFTRASRVTLKSCRITDIESGAFEDIYYLKYIDLAENKISSFQPDQLYGNLKVTHLNLSYNLITTLPTGLFSQKPNLQTLDLKGNRLNSLAIDLFVPLQKLILLDLSYNDFVGKEMSPYLFTKTRKIQYLDISKNDMSDTPENLLSALQELKDLTLDRCSLTSVPQFATRPNLRTMKHLTLSTNQITSIDQLRFIYLENLETLNLAENLIETVDSNAFIYLKSIKIIILRDNKLKILPDGFFRNLAKLTTVDLARNMLEYVPLNAFRGTAIQELNLSHNRFSYLDLYFSSQLRNGGMKINKFLFNDNPWQCACLNDIINEMKSFGIEYNGDKYDGQHTVCVTTNKFTCKRDLVDNKLFIEMYDNANK